MIKIIKIAVKLIKKPKLDLFLFFSLTALATLLEIFSIGIILPLLQNLTGKPFCLVTLTL